MCWTYYLWLSTLALTRSPQHHHPLKPSQYVEPIAQKMYHVNFFISIFYSVRYRFVSFNEIKQQKKNENINLKNSNNNF